MKRSQFAIMVFASLGVVFLASEVALGGAISVTEDSLVTTDTALVVAEQTARVRSQSHAAQPLPADRVRHRGLRTPGSPSDAIRPNGEAITVAQVVSTGPRDEPVLAYSNVTHDSGHGVADFQGVLWGDDLTLTAVGTVESVQFSLMHLAWNNTCGYAAADYLTGCDIEVGFADIDDPRGNVYGIVVDEHLDWTANPLPVGYGYTYTCTDLSGAGVALPERSVVMTQKATNFTGTSSGGGSPEYSHLGPFIFENTGTAPDVGSSDDVFWYDDTDASFPVDYEPCDSAGGGPMGADWLWFSGIIKADFYFAVSLVDVFEIPMAARTTPVLPGDSGSFWIAPTDDNGVGGQGVWLEADGSAQLTYASGMATALMADTNSLAGHSFLKFICRSLDGPANDIQFDSPDPNDPNGLFTPRDFHELQMVFDNTIDFYATDGRFLLNKDIEISDYDGGSPMVDLDALGDGTTPFSRRYDPIMDVSEYPDANGLYPYEWITLTAEVSASNVVDKWVLTYQDGTYAEEEMLPGEHSIDIRVDTFKEVYAVYYYLPPRPCGDANGDGSIDVFDIDAFVYALTHDETAFLAKYPYSSYYYSDTNCDASVDVFDIDGFVEAITTGTACDCGG